MHNAAGPRRSQAIAAATAAGLPKRGETLFDDAHAVLDLSHIGANRPQEFQDQVFGIVGHGGKYTFGPYTEVC